MNDKDDGSRKVHYEEDAFVKNITNNYFEEKKKKKQNVLETMMDSLISFSPYSGKSFVLEIISKRNINRH
jgi:hypothetical protein